MLKRRKIKSELVEPSMINTRITKLVKNRGYLFAACHILLDTFGSLLKNSSEKE